MNYLPQAAPFVMIDRLVRHQPDQTVSSYTIREDNLFVFHGVFTEPGLIENMAQTAAAGMGYVAATENRKPEVGFIGQITRLEIASLPPCGATIETTIDPQHQILNVLLVNGSVRLNGACIASASFKIFLQQDDR